MVEERFAILPNEYRQLQQSLADGGAVFRETDYASVPYGPALGYEYDLETAWLTLFSPTNYLVRNVAYYRRTGIMLALRMKVSEIQRSKEPVESADLIVSRLADVEWMGFYCRVQSEGQLLFPDTVLGGIDGGLFYSFVVDVMFDQTSNDLRRRAVAYLESNSHVG